MKRPWALLAGAAVAIGCAAPTHAARREAMEPAISALRGGSFERAAALAAGDADDPYAAIVRAIARYEKTAHLLAVDGRTLVAGAVAGGLNERYLRTTVTEAEAELARVEADLAIAARHPGLSLELCPACWEVDWNGNGRVDSGDRRLLEIEVDENGESLPEGDPRRRPTFRFDDGDVPWARAFVSFERAALDVVLAYDWSNLPQAIGETRSSPSVRIPLVAPDRIAAARALLLAGLDHSDAARRAYLAETDDDREWVPNPRQKSHPMPLTVNAALYETWEGVVGDVRRLVRGEEALSLDAVAELFSRRSEPEPPAVTPPQPMSRATMGQRSSERPRRRPRGYLDIGRMLAHPKDLVVDQRDLRRLDKEALADEALASFFGEYYVRDARPSALPRRLLRMKGEIDRDEEGFGRKLRYLFWLN